MRSSVYQPAAATPAASISIGWQSLGPAPIASDASGTGMQDYGPVSGRVTAVAVDPADPSGNTVYLGAANGGVWRSQNAAAGSYGNAASVSWVPLTDDQPTLATGAIALQPGNATGNLSNMILVGTGEANSSGDSYYGLGFLRSTDKGATWSLISAADGGTHPFTGLAVSKIVFSTAQPSLVVAGVGFSTSGQIEGGDDLKTTPHGLYYSLDAGASWHLATVQDSGITIAPDSPRGIVYNRAANKFYAAIRRHGFYASADGITWSRLANQPGGGVLASSNCPANVGSATCPIVRGELAVVPGRNEMYAWFTDFNSAVNPPDVDQGIWQSIDGGANWTAISTAGIASCGDIVGGCGTEQGEFNMTLAAVPNRSATDLYAGAVNLFKCTLTAANPDCRANPFLNLTHAYGCPPNFGSTAHVHPNQHAMDYMLLNSGSMALMYFGNDGGIYRAMDGFTGLVTGTCSGKNQFDSLNSVGSLAEFIHISEDPSNIDVLLGGTQDNGSPATNGATTGGAWQSVNTGDGGFTAIDPTNPTSWFTSHADIGGGHLAVEHCTGGINCHAQDFSTGVVVSSYDLQGDDGGFFFPYLLDSRNSNEMLVGTCRIWMGPALGGSFIPLSNNFESGTQSTCSGSEVNTVTSIAAGGPGTPSGLSKVVYATTSGFGPLTKVLSVPAGGRIFVTTDSSTTLMSEVTAGINPVHYPISAVAIDASDPSGRTAYVTIMGFGSSHVFKTTNAGASWTDFTGSGLPDAPANTVLVDEQAGIVYVGTDVGVFSSPTSSPVWSEVGPAAGAGALPNTAVFDLKLWRSSGQAYLRAATHGRGVWQIAVAAGFQIAMANTSRTIFPMQQATFSGTITAMGGYSSPVALICTSGKTAAPSTCTASPATVVPSSSGASFQVTAADNVGDYTFNIHAVGSDPHNISQDQALALQVVDFALSAPSPASVVANRPNTSDPATFRVSAFGSFSQTVQLSCAGLPSGASCNFSPGNSVAPTAVDAVDVTLTIATSSSTPPGTYSVTIKGTTTTPAASRTQTVSLTVTNAADYVLSINNSPQSAWVGQNATFNGRLSAANGYSSTVDLSCAAGGSGPPPTCTITPATLPPSASGASFSVTTKSNVGQSYSFAIVATGRDSNHLSHASLITFNSVDFAVSATPSSQSIKPGQAAVFVLHVVPAGGNLLSPVTFACSGLPALATCAFNPTSIPSGSGAADVTLTVATTGSNLSGLATHRFGSNWQWLLLALPLVGMAVGACWRCGSPRKYTAVMFSSLVGVMLIFQACGGGASTGGGTPSPPAPVSLTISPASASVEILAKQQFQASVFGSSDTRVLWNVNGNAGGNQSTGLIDANGLYTAPALVPNPAVVSIVAVSVADRTRNAAAAVNITSPVTVRVNPVNANVGVGGTQQFTAAVSGVSNQAVNWSVNHKPGGDPSCGKIDKNGLYSAPLTIPNPPTVTVTAISQVDWRQQATATVSIAAIGISLSPSSASVYTNGTQQFTASVTGTPITQVDWKVNGVTGGNAAVGTISSAGLYTAPTFLPSPSTVTVTAVSQADTSKSASAAVTILPSTPLGTFTISITASAGPVTRNRNLSLSIVP